MAMDMYAEIRTFQNLHTAWRKVKESADSSLSESIRDEAKAFESLVPGNLVEIQRSLQKRSFSFAPQTGVAKKKSSGSARPIVLSPIPNRIVQRAILQVLQKRVGLIKESQAFHRSYGGGGVRNKASDGPSKNSVAKALSDVKEVISAGARFHIRSDIPQFFMCVKKDVVMTKLRAAIKCPDTIRLLEAAISTDLLNIDELQKKGLAEIFPLGPEGLAQGSPLSPMLANLYLFEFDRAMNSGPVDCFRYVDDFLILGADEAQVDRAFAKAQRLLRKLELKAYAPIKGSDKASRGEISKGFDFLGCHVTSGMIQPSRRSRKRFKEKIEGITRSAKAALLVNSDGKSIERKHAYARALGLIDLTVLGWGMAFGFCKPGQWVESLDECVSDNLDEIEHHKEAAMKRADGKTKRHLLGVRCLRDLEPFKDNSKVTSR